MTEEQIKQNAEEFILPLKVLPGADEKIFFIAAIREAFVAGAHSCDEEISQWELAYNNLLHNFNERGNELAKQSIELNQLRNPWISVEEGLPEKAIGLYELEEDERHKMVLFKTANGKHFIGYLDAEEIWRAFTVPYRMPYPIDSFTLSKVSHWMPIPQLLKGGEK